MKLILFKTNIEKMLSKYQEKIVIQSVSFFFWKLFVFRKQNEFNTRFYNYFEIF